MGANLKHTPGHIDCPACDGLTNMTIRTISGNMTFEDAFNRWIENLTIQRAGVVTNARYLSERGISDLKQYARAASRFFGRIPLEKIHAGHLMTYQQARAVCDNTVNGEGADGKENGWAAPAGANLIRKEVQVVVRLMKAAAVWDKDKMARTWRPLEVVVNDVPRALTPREQQTWLETVSRRPEWQTIYWYTIVGLETSCSSNELRGLRLGDIFLDNGTLEVRMASAKNVHRKRTIPLVSEQVVWALSKLMEQARERGAREPYHYLFPKHISANRYNPSKPMTVSGIKKPWNAVRRAAGLPDFRIYDLRHTAITRMAEAGVPIPVMLDFAGHISLAMQRHYTHISMNAKRRWAATAFAGAEMPFTPAGYSSGSSPAWQEQAPAVLGSSAAPAQRRLMR